MYPKQLKHQNLVKHTIFTFLLIFQLIYLKCALGLLLKCPLHQMHLQKIIGFRPPMELMTGRNQIYSSRNVEASLINTSAPTSEICWTICDEDIDCIAYVHLLDSNECFGYSFIERTDRFMEIGGEFPLIADSKAIFYEKTCLNVPEDCRNHLWAITKIPGTSLMFQEKKTISTLVTRRECAEKCLFEREFQCLSASFTPSYRNNRERLFPKTLPSSQPHYSTLGRCMLSDKDKMIQPDAFRAAPYNEEYIENQCYERPIENDNCAYELYANSTFIYAEARFSGLSQKECQASCSNETRFYCQGASFYFNGDIRESECLLHSEDIVSMGPRSLMTRDQSIYMRRVKCLDVQVICTRKEMLIKYTPKESFQGKLYVNLHSKDCTANGYQNGSIILRLAIGNEAKENRCGILRAYELTQDFHRTFISTLVVIQNNPMVQTQGDRLIKVGCIISNSTLNDNQIRREGRENLKDEDDLPNAVALESSLEITQQFLPNEGALHFNDTFLNGPMPKITLQVIDLSHKHETNDVQIGQNLELQIIAEYTQAQKDQENLNDMILPQIPDFRATSLIAKTEDKQNFVLLIDEKGCPIDKTVFPALERLRTHSKNILRARFQAFKFAGTSDVNFAVKIHFCAKCPENNCVQYGSNNQSKMSQSIQNRKRRQLDTTIETNHQFKVQNPVYISTVEDINLNEVLSVQEEPKKINSTGTNSSLDSNTLKYNLHVRGPDQVNSNQFIYGERGILIVAGIDEHMRLDTFCVNQSLLIATLIFWLIFQVALLFGCCYVIQKYKSLAKAEEVRRKMHDNLDYLESRRVHWADQGGYTL